MELIEATEDEALFLDALGAGLVAAESGQPPPDRAELFAPPGLVEFEKVPALSDWRSRVHRLTRAGLLSSNGGDRRLILGFDIGSTGSKLVALDADTVELMHRIDRIYTQWPFFGGRRICAMLRQERRAPVNHKRVQRLMQRMGLQAIYPRKRLSQPQPGHRVYPYLLRGVKVDRPDQAWASDITYLPLQGGFVYLVAVMDWFSRYVLAWGVSITMDVAFCVEALGHALGTGKPEIFNTDQGSRFTSRSFTGLLEAEGIMISMDGRPLPKCRSIKPSGIIQVMLSNIQRSAKDREMFFR